MTTQRTRGPLSDVVARLCADLRGRVGADTANGLHEVVLRLGEPLQLAVVGRIKSGKSTLVNALIGRNVAPTDVGECTRVVTRFRYGTVDRVEVVLRDGGKRSLPFTSDGAIPADLGVERERVSHLEAYLTNEALRDLTVIDTPGLGSTDDSSVARTEAVLGREAVPGESGAAETGAAGTEAAEPEERAEALDPVSRSAVAGAEAVLYVVTQSVRADDRRALSSFGAATGNRPAGPANALAVLNKADTVEPESVRESDGSVWHAASLLAGRQARQLGPRVTDVLPVVGLLAETAETGVFTASDAEALHRLAGLDETTRETLLISADLFTGWECDVPTGTRTRLLELLDLYGIRCALEAIAADPDITAGELRRVLHESSGLSEVSRRLNAVFRARADGIKAAAGLASMTAVAQRSRDPAERGRIQDGIEALLARPDAHQLRLLEVLTLVSSGEVTLPNDLLDEVLRLGASNNPSERLGMLGGAPERLLEYAMERANWWRSFASLGATPAQSRVAHVVHRAYFLLWQQLRSGTRG
ncbi:Dynamin family protein [Actinopolyspora mzabensis]|uniref:Dynamin family protein n=1 Tax=Actinopolyspora mzabensis TaxID=995066 RepID=A0A1G8X6H8_ACTMZ|nr:dynamin family protein [Actinopolyspora mzabensis]SDJ86024.1 Dynamin family protein [Actinopolyspora mzabensis]